MKIKELFEKAENHTLTWDQFTAAAKEAGAKFEDISEGNYVSKNKYTDDLSAKDTEIQTLNQTLSARDTDLQDLQTRLTEAGTDKEKLTTLSTDFESLKTKYAQEVKDYKAKLQKQSYEFAVREFANGKKFTSNAARRDFINSMIAKDLKMENGKILGADDFVTAYSTDNSDAFVVETPEPAPKAPKPSFAASTPGEGAQPTPDDAFINAFNFTGVRTKKED